MPMIALEAIDDAPRSVRPTGASRDDDAALRASIHALGVLQPILLRPAGNRFVVVAGARRLAAAREIGLVEIPAHVEKLAPRHELAAQAAENMVRVAMAPLDQWRAIVALQADGYTLTHAAACLGLSDRAARRLDKLGRLHPDVIALIERQGMPDADDLAEIANAPPDMQAQALKAAKEGKLV